MFTCSGNTDAQGAMCLGEVTIFISHALTRGDDVKPQGGTIQAGPARLNMIACSDSQYARVVCVITQRLNLRVQGTPTLEERCASGRSQFLFLFFFISHALTSGDDVNPKAVQYKRGLHD